MKIDSYIFQARVLPAIIFMLPFFIEANCLIVFFDFKIEISAPIANLILIVFLILFANWARHFGRKKEKKLLEKWDGLPTTRFLRSDNIEYNEYRRAEIKKYLKMMFSNVKMPTRQEEQINKNECDKKYEAYISNLQALTRNTKEFALLQSENRNYGMWRNLLGLKLISIVCILIIISINMLLAIFFSQVMSWKNCIILNIVLAFLALILFFIVTESKVKDIAECYARRLFDTVIILKDKNIKKNMK